MARFFIIVFSLLLVCGACLAQSDSATIAPVANTVYAKKKLPLLDSVAHALAIKQKRVSDSLAMLFIKRPNPARHNQFAQYIIDNYLYKGYGYLDIPSRANITLGTGVERKLRDNKIIAVLLFVVLYAGFLRLFITKDINRVLQAVFSKNISTATGAESSMLSNGAFCGLMILMGLTAGVFIYQLSAYYQVYYRVSGLNLFLAICAITILLFVTKLVILKFLGYVFQVNELVNLYINIICLTYFSITFVLLPMGLCLTLLNAALLPLVLTATIVLVGIILIWLYARNCIIIISGIQFSKFYLFVYLCALEICPILVLIKALKI